LSEILTGNLSGICLPIAEGHQCLFLVTHNVQAMLRSRKEDIKSLFILHKPCTFGAGKVNDNNVPFASLPSVNFVGHNPLCNLGVVFGHFHLASTFRGTLRPSTQMYLFRLLDFRKCCFEPLVGSFSYRQHWSCEFYHSIVTTIVWQSKDVCPGLVNGGESVAKYCQLKAIAGCRHFLGLHWK